MARFFFDVNDNEILLREHVNVTDHQYSDLSEETKQERIKRTIDCKNELKKGRSCYGNGEN